MLALAIALLTFSGTCQADRAKARTPQVTDWDATVQKAHEHRRMMVVALCPGGMWASPPANNAWNTGRLPGQ